MVIGKLNQVLVDIREAWVEKLGEYFVIVWGWDFCLHED